ncbi:MAG: class I SAM-dependent methyltransferase [Acidiferrobacter thiooxydans]
MDLRKFGLSSAQIERAGTVLNYQPFIVTDEFQTGVAYSWLYSEDPRVAPPLVFRRPKWESEWDKISAANGRLRMMYDDFIDEIARRYPGGSLLDVACNNGYFPVQASRIGMKNCAGSDLGAHHAEAIGFLNDVVGTDAKFIHAPYDPATGRLATQERYDVVVAAAIMCHLPNPLRFLAALGAVTKEAIFFWGQMLDTEELVSAYKPPHPNLSEEQVFPYCFNDNTRVSKGLFREAAKQMGFREVSFLEPKTSWLFTKGVEPGDLKSELRIGSAHVAVLATR